MKKLTELLEVSVEKDNVLTAFAKGGFKGYLKYSAVILPLMSTVLLVGKCISKKEELEKFEQESGAE
jgi:hypothetical protein